MRAICTLCGKIAYQNPKMVCCIIIIKILLKLSSVMFDCVCGIEGTIFSVCIPFELDSSALFLTIALGIWLDATYLNC